MLGDDDNIKVNVYEEQEGKYYDKIGLVFKRRKKPLARMSHHL